jgi:hypothetical protein
VAVAGASAGDVQLQLVATCDTGARQLDALGADGVLAFADYDTSKAIDNEPSSL